MLRDPLGIRRYAARMYMRCAFVGFSWLLLSCSGDEVPLGGGAADGGSLAEARSPSSESESESDSEVAVSEQRVVSNVGDGDLEGHTPRGFGGMGTGLFAGDEINPGFPSDDGVQIFLSFPIGDLPGSEVVEAELASDVEPSVRGTPFEDLGDLVAEEIRFDAFSGAIFDTEAEVGGRGCIFAASAQGPFRCDVTDLVQRAVDDQRDFAQVRLRFERASNSNGSSDLVAFFLTDSNTNEPGIFSLTIEVLP